MQKPVNAHEVFKAAFSYNTASADLRRKTSTRVVQHAYPSLQLSFISIELYLKCLLLILTGQMRVGHELDQLYRKLPPHVKTDLNNQWATGFANGPYPKMPDHILGKLPETMNLYTVLRHANFMQQHSRYPWEKSGHEKVFIVQELPDLLYEYVIKLKPTWRFPVLPA